MESMTPYVSTELFILKPAPSGSEKTEVAVDGRTYRRLDPLYYAWLRCQMKKAKDAHERGQLPTTAFDALRIQFNTLHDQAIALFGESSLLEAIRLLDSKSYPWPGRTREESGDPTHAEIPEIDEQPAPRCSPDTPSIPEESSLDGMSQHSYPAEAPDRFRFNQPVSKCALAQVDAIRDQAQALGWTEAQLYQTRGRFAFPCGDDCGLICFVRRDQRIGKVTDKTIEIICPGGHSQSFYRKEVNS
mgnify:FL=1